MTEITELLRIAVEHDMAARECRKAAGRILAAAREEMPSPEFLGVIHELGLDLETVALLVRLSTGSEATT